jgi:hypothetical protein
MPTIDLYTLPLNAQQTLLDFYEFLQEKYSYTKTNAIALTVPQELDNIDFKIFIINIPKMDGNVFERQHDYLINNPGE